MRATGVHHRRVFRRPSRWNAPTDVRPQAGHSGFDAIARAVDIGVMSDAERIEALLDLVDPARTGTVNRGQALAVLGLAQGTAKGGYRPTSAGWVLMGDRGRPFQPRSSRNR